MRNDRRPQSATVKKSAMPTLAPTAHCGWFMRIQGNFLFAMLVLLSFVMFTSQTMAQSSLNIRELGSGTAVVENNRMAPNKDTFLELIMEKGASSLRDERVTGYKYPDTYVTAVMENAYSVDMSRQEDRDCAAYLIGNVASRLQGYYKEGFDDTAFIAREVQQAKDGACRNSPAAYEGALAALDDITAAYEAPIREKEKAENDMRQRALETLAAGAPDNGEPTAIRAQNAVIRELRENVLSMPELSARNSPLTQPLSGHMDAAVNGMELSPTCKKMTVNTRAVPSAVNATWKYFISPATSTAPSEQQLEPLGRYCSPDEITQIQSFVDKAGEAMDSAIPATRQRLAEAEKQRAADTLARRIERDKRISEEEHRRAEETRQRAAVALAAKQQREKEVADHTAQLKSGAKPIETYSDAIAVFDAEDGTRDIAHPLGNPSGKIISAIITVERISDNFILGSFGDHYVGVRISGKTKNAAADTVRVNLPIRVVGEYHENMELLSGTSVVIDALFIGSR